ncbi:MAG: hypothetical protein HY360_13515 [Verrucomicrobia bacterium]|nr:hypothetical protein [Verrucomicrobiota bacterium]
MKAAKKDDSGIFDSILVHFGPDKARFHPAHLKINRSIITVPSAWQFKPLTEVGLKVQLPPGKTRTDRPIECRGIIVECRPLKQKGRYHVDLLLTEIPSRHANLFERLRPGIRPSVR